MPTRFENAPLVELIAELRWQTPTANVPLPAGALQFVTAQPEEFFMRFGGRVAGRGYTRVERIVPPGFPSAPFQATYRFRRDGQEQGTSLYQIGPGMFSANITPPYHSWTRFRPIVAEGISLFLEARGDAEFSDIIQASLRYIDNFGDRFLQGLSPIEFIQNRLGLTIGLPEGILSEILNRQEIIPFLRLNMPLRAGQVMALNVGHGMVNSEPGIVMDTTVSAPGPIAANAEAIMAAFDASHDIIHRSFLEITRSLHQNMGLVEENG